MTLGLFVHYLPKQLHSICRLCLDGHTRYKWIQRWCRHENVQPQDTGRYSEKFEHYRNHLIARWDCSSPNLAPMTSRLLQPDRPRVRRYLLLDRTKVWFSMAAYTWLNSCGGGENVVGVNQYNNTDFLRSIGSRMVYMADPSCLVSAATASHIHRRYPMRG